MNNQTTTTQTRQEAIFSAAINFLNKTGLDIDFSYHLQNEDFEDADDVESILDDASAFDIDIIYYSTAIAYLGENDASLKESLSIAHELGYTLDNLSSEMLASLLASQNAREEFNNIKNDLDAAIIEAAELWDEENPEEEED
jgi:hypothetical protein